jgi:hypothetical protein
MTKTQPLSPVAIRKEGRGMSSSADERRPILTLGQILVLIFAPTAIVSLHAGLFLIRRYVTAVDPVQAISTPGYAFLFLTILRHVTDFYDVLWEREAAVQMLAATWLLAAIGELILVVQFIICNRLRARWRNSLLVTLLVLTTCFAPAVLVLVVGPQILRQAYQQEDQQREGLDLGLQQGRCLPNHSSG